VINAIVLAGALNKSKLSEVSTEPYEASIEIAGKPMIWYVVKALLNSEKINKVLIVGPEDISDIDYGPEAVDRVELTLCSGNMIDNLLRGIDRFVEDKKILVATSDIPMITAEAIDDFINRCETVDADIYYSIGSKEDNESKYPGVARTYVKLTEGTFTGGNIVLLAPGVISRNRNIIAQAYALRKKPLKMARLLGFKVIIKMMFNRMSVAELEKRVQKLLGCKCKAIISPYPEVGIDVDKPSDLTLADKILSSKE
jgi:GTP:adenosylcobinamide-phosphate guanylyltransferase